MSNKELTVNERQVLGAITDGDWDHIKVDRALYREIMAELRGVEAAKAQAWDEGYEACLYDTNTGATANPYRQPKGPTR